VSWSEKVVERWWACILVGVGVIGLTILQRGQLLKLQTGEVKSVFVDPLTKLAYDIAGVGGATTFGVLIGLFLIGYGGWLFTQKSR
jgi:hypothetical protein